MLTNSHGNPTNIAKLLQQATFKTTLKPLPTQIISNTPQRLRLRISPRHRHLREMQRIVNILKAQPNIREVRINVNSGSVVVNHDGREATLENILSTLLEIGVSFTDITATKSEAAKKVKGAVVNFNKKFEQATSGEVDLRFLFPLGLSLLAVRQILVKGWQLELIPWYVLAWYSFDSFIKLNGANDWTLD